jgi:uncharacterized membrane protein YsdA (DUF1294 family)
MELNDNIILLFFSFDYNGFTITGYDKYLSKIQRRRIGENTLSLHCLEEQLEPNCDAFF